MDSDGKRIFGVLLFMFIVTLGIVFENMSLKNENVQLKEEIASLTCSPLGFCIGDKVQPTDDAKRWNITIGGVVRKVEGKLLYIDTGNENWHAVDASWVRHEESKTGECYLRLSNGVCIPLDKIGFIRKESIENLCQYTNCNNATEYTRRLSTFIIANNLLNKKIILIEQ